MKNSRRKFIQALSAGFLIGNQSLRADPSRPNILLILADQHRGMDAGFAGNRQLQTPNLDLLAKQGIVFQNAIANSPLCTPSRAILLTGKYPLKTGAVSNDLPLTVGQETIATALNRRGYQCGYIGKWHLDGIPRSRFTPPGPRRHGFDAFWAAYNCHHEYFKPKYYLNTPELIEKGGYEPEVQTDLAIDFITRHRSSPFCLMVAFGPPHDPYLEVPARYRTLYPPDQLELRPNVQNPQREQISGYLAHITALDDCVGRLLNTLDNLQIQNNTIVVYTSDHGDMLWSQGRNNKQQPWEESIRVPLVIRWPHRIKSGKVSHDLFGTADLTPTLLGLTHTTVPEAMEGLDLSRRILTGNGRRHHSVPIIDIIPTDQAKQWGGKPWRGVRTGRYTFARWQDHDWVLYDNHTDPYQLHNLVDQPEYKRLRDRLENELQAWLQRMGDSFLSVDEQLRALGLAEAWDQRNAHFASGKNW